MVHLFTCRFGSVGEISRQASVESEAMNLGLPIARPSRLGSRSPLKHRRMHLSLTAHSGPVTLLASFLLLVQEWFSTTGTLRKILAYSSFWLTQRANKGINWTFMHLAVGPVRLWSPSFSHAGLGCIKASYASR